RPPIRAFHDISIPKVLSSVFASRQHRNPPRSPRVSTEQGEKSLLPHRRTAPPAGPNERHPARSDTDDLAYINRHGPGIPDTRIDQKLAGVLRVGDDFVTVPLPEIAAADTPETAHLVAEAIQRYNAEQAVVDDRLFRKIDVKMKGGDLHE